MDLHKFERRLKKAGWVCTSRRGWRTWMAPDGEKIILRHGGRWNSVPPWLVRSALDSSRDVVE